jgi:hypothetical protein
LDPRSHNQSGRAAIPVMVKTWRMSFMMSPVVWVHVEYDWIVRPAFLSFPCFCPLLPYFADAEIS